MLLSNVQNNKRVLHFDVITGIMIVLMILGHIKSHAGYDSVFFHYRHYLFIMPWFFFKSGMLSKSVLSIGLIKRNARKLLLPWLIWGAIGELLFLFCLCYEGDLSVKDLTVRPLKFLLVSGSFRGNAALWFLPTFFFTQLFGNYAIKIVKNNCLLWVIASLCMIIAYLFSQPSPLGVSANINGQAYTPPFVWMYTTIEGLSFYLSGYLMRDKLCNNKIFVFSTVGYVLCCIIGYPFVNMAWNELLIGNYFLWYVSSICAIILMIYVGRFVERFYKSHVLAYVGQNSMQYYVVHWPIMILLCRLLCKDVLQITSPTFVFCIGVIGSFILLSIYTVMYNKILAK